MVEWDDGIDIHGLDKMRVSRRSVSHTSTYCIALGVSKESCVMVLRGRERGDNKSLVDREPSRRILHLLRVARFRSPVLFEIDPD